MLKISPELSLPLDAVTQTFGILAVRGAGKTNTARVEEIRGTREPHVADPRLGPHTCYAGDPLCREYMLLAALSDAEKARDEALHEASVSDGAFLEYRHKHANDIDERTSEMKKMIYALTDRMDDASQLVKMLIEQRDAALKRIGEAESLLRLGALHLDDTGLFNKYRAFLAPVSSPERVDG